jgi:predicted nucleic acid-binding protein
MLTLPASGYVSVDTNAVIYTVQHHPVYAPLLGPLWHAAADGALTVVASELVLCEVLTGAYKFDDEPLATAYEAFLQSPGVILAPITRVLLRSVARLRANARLRVPDAIHAATALDAGCTLFVTNDPHFRRVSGLEVAVLDDIVAGRQAP